MGRKRYQLRDTRKTSGYVVTPPLPMSVILTLPQKLWKQEELDHEEDQEFARSSEGILGESTNQIRLQLNPSRPLFVDHRYTKLPDLEKIDQRYPHHRRTCHPDHDSSLG